MDRVEIVVSFMRLLRVHVRVRVCRSMRGTLNFSKNRRVVPPRTRIPTRRQFHTAKLDLHLQDEAHTHLFELQTETSSDFLATFYLLTFHSLPSTLSSLSSHSWSFNEKELIRRVLDDILEIDLRRTGVIVKIKY